MHYSGGEFDLEPENYFYNWLYIKAISQNPEYLKEVLFYDSFTDIEFNPNKSINCQAMAVATCVGLHKSNKFAEAIKDKDTFYNIVYGTSITDVKKEEHYQMSLFDI